MILGGLLLGVLRVTKFGKRHPEVRTKIYFGRAHKDLLQPRWAC